MSVTHHHHFRSTMLAAACALGLAACASTPPPPPVAEAAPVDSTKATVHLASASGSLVSGTLHLAPMGDGVHVTGEIGGLDPSSTHGFHVHEIGDCSAADASSAGGHFNPVGSPHGRAGHGPHHLGDSDNIVANAQGVAQISAHLSDVSLGTGMANDIGGRAIVVHAEPDDYSSQPSGNAGARVGCGVIAVQQ